MSKLIVMRPEGEHEVFELTGDSATIGRLEQNTIMVDDDHCSRRHCQILRISSGFELVDLKSRNGTKVNGVKRDRYVLSDGDIIEIGNVRITYREREGAEEEVVLEDFGRESEVSVGGDCFLVYADGDRKGQKVVLSEDRLTMGRKETNKLVLKDQMVSSYHCEITREGGGFVLRDLGSTNGSIVNGEAVSEVALTHGANIRIGRTRFVFVDPAVADFEQAMASEEEAETDWGLMRTQVDLARVKRARRASIVWTLVVLLVLAALPALFFLKPDLVKGILGVEETAVVTDVAGNLIPDASFENRELPWAVPEEEPGEARIVKGLAHQGEQVLQLLGPEEGFGPVVVRCPEEISVAGRRFYEISAWVLVEAQGTSACAGVRWSIPGQDRVSLYSFTEWSGGEEWARVRTVVSPPEGADHCRPVLALAGEGSARFDDIVFREVQEAGRPAAAFVNGSFRITVSEGGTVGVERSGGHVLWNGGLVGVREDGSLISPDLCFRARKVEVGDRSATVRGALWVPGSGEVPVTLGLEQMDDRVRVGYELTGGTAGLAWLGLGVEVDRDYVQEGATLSGEHGAREIAGETDETGVRKVILGGAGRRLSLVAAEPTRLRIFSGAGLVTTLLAPPSEKNRSFDIVTDFTEDRKDAQEVLRVARAARNLGQLGEAIAGFDRVVNEFPFDDSLRDTAREERDELLAKGRERIDKAKKTFEGAEKFYDERDLEEALDAATQTAADYGGNALGAEAADLAGKIRQTLEKYRRARHERVAGRLKLQLLDFEARGQKRLAKAFREEILRRYPDTSVAEELKGQ